MKVAILTMFAGLSSTYSLVNVVADQLQMLLDAGLSVKMLVSENCPDGERTGIFADPRLQWVKITNTLNGQPIHWRDYSTPTGSVHSTFYQEADAIAQDFVRHLQDVDVCILHDILYQGWHLVHNIALRKAQTELPHLRFLSFTHSLPALRPETMEAPFSARFTPMPNTIFVYPTRSGLPALSRQYGVPLDQCAAVYNCLPLLSSMSQDVQKVARHMDLLGAEVLAIYPGRLTTGKRLEKVAALCGAIQKVSSRQTRAVFCDFPCADIPPDLYKKMIRTEGKKYGLSADNLLFTSDIVYPLGFPREGVMELFQLSNLFICPSYSESFGLTVLEAASQGNFLVLNQAVPALQELGEKLGAYFLRWDARNFGFDTRETYNPSEQAYYEDHGRDILRRMDSDPALFAKTLVRTHYSHRWVMENQLLPLLKG